MSRTFKDHREDQQEAFERPVQIHVERCGYSHKICFPSHEAALMRAAMFEQAESFRAYKCEACKRYHLTSQPRNL